MIAVIVTPAERHNLLFVKTVSQLSTTERCKSCRILWNRMELVCLKGILETQQHDILCSHLICHRYQLATNVIIALSKKDLTQNDPGLGLRLFEQSPSFYFPSSLLGEHSHFCWLSRRRVTFIYSIFMSLWNYVIREKNDFEITIDRLCERGITICMQQKAITR